MNSEAGIEIEKADESDQKRFLARLQELQALPDPPAITLTNVYKEVPITHQATICDVKGNHVELKTSELQLASIAQCNEAYLQSPLLSWTLLGRLYSIDFRRTSVKLADFREAELEVWKRKTVRVRLKRPVSVKVSARGETVTGVIHDVSLGGGCIMTLGREELRESKQAEMEFALTPHCSETIRIPCTVVAVDGEAPPFRCTFSFEHTRRSEQFLSVFIYQRQLEIVRELREVVEMNEPY